MHKGRNMNLRSIALIAGILFAGACWAAPPPNHGTIVSMQSVECGQKHEGKKKSTALLCQQYVVHTATTEYQVRQQKPEEQEIIPANTAVEFKLDKSKMKLKANGKKYEFLVVGTSALSTQ